MTNPSSDMTGAAKLRPAGSSIQVVCDPSLGNMTLTVELAALPERVFRALTSEEICKWWVRPGVFDTREWTGDLRPGGHWQAAGVGNGRPYRLEGEFLEIDAPEKLVHTWQPVGMPGAPTVVTYLLERIDGGTRLTTRHTGFTMPEVCANTAAGWQTSFERLAAMLAAESADDGL